MLTCFKLVVSSTLSLIIGLLEPTNDQVNFGQKSTHVTAQLHLYFCTGAASARSADWGGVLSVQYTYLSVCMYVCQ